MTAQRAAALARLREALRLPLAGVVVRRRRSQEPEFSLTLDGGEVIPVKRASTLLSQQRTRVLVFGITLRLIPHLTRAEWVQVVQLMLDICEEEQPRV
jgi:hypothetical protein